MAQITVRAVLACVLAIAGLAEAADLTFAQKPAVVREGRIWKISFALSKSTDVEIAILDRTGRTVRHLAAGVLGADSTPPPPLREGLAQSIDWDGNDDSGKPAAGDPFKLRIRAGMSSEFGRMFGGSPNTGNITDQPYRAPVNGLVVDADGSLLIKMMSTVGSHGNSGLWPWQLRRFDKAGRYIKTLLPYAPSVGADRASGFSLLNTPDGAFTPVNQNSLYPVFYNFGDELLNRLIDGQVVFINSRQRQLTFFKLDGSNAIKTVAMWPQSAKLNAPAWLNFQVAISPDGRYAYYSNVAGTAYDGKKPSDIDPNWPQGRIYRHDLHNPDAAPERFFDLQLPDFERSKYWMPSAWDKKTAAAGIDVDSRGNVLVGDLVNQQLVEIAPDGRKLSATAVPWPDKVIVSRKTGAVYVISRPVSRGALPVARLYKITGRGADAKITAELPLRGALGGACALDESGAVAVLWLGGGGSLWRVEDRGNELALTGSDLLNSDRNAITFLGYMDVDGEAELVYITASGSSIWRYDGRTGQGSLLPIKAVDLAVGAGGMIYTWGDQGSYSGPVTRYTRDLEPAPLASTGKHTYGRLEGRAGRGASVCGMDVDWRGRVYAVYGSNVCHLRVYGADGALFPFELTIVPRDEAKSREPIPVAVDYISGYGGSIRVDRDGNIYLLQHGLPKGFSPPPGYEKDEAWRQTAGSIVKLPPQGSPRNYPLDDGGRGKDPLGFKNVLNTYGGCGPISGWRCDGACACVKARFDVDAYGRLYIPNAITFTVRVCDNAGNSIVSFGQYGNYDCQGAQSAEPKPAIPLGWPIAVGASEDHIYVGDCLNHRVVRVDKRFALEATSDVPRPEVRP